MIEIATLHADFNSIFVKLPGSSRSGFWRDAEFHRLVHRPQGIDGEEGGVQSLAGDRPIAILSRGQSPELEMIEPNSRRFPKIFRGETSHYCKNTERPPQTWPRQMPEP